MNKEKYLNEVDNIVLVYHSVDNDGRIGAAQILNKIEFYRGFSNDVVLIGGNYQNDDEIESSIYEMISNHNNSEIIIVDYHLSIDFVIKAINTGKAHITLIDHHISAIRKYLDAGFIYEVEDNLYISKPVYSDVFSAYMDSRYSGCALAEFYFTNSDYNVCDILSVKNISMLSEYISTYDTWNTKSNKWNTANDVNFGLLKYTSEDDIRYISSIISDGILYEDFIKSCLSEGKIINEYLSKKRKNYAERVSFDVYFENYKFRAINASGGSKAVESSADETHDGLMTFSFNGKNWNVSLYHNPKSANKPDFSVIATKYGGGGHAGACGFTMDKLTFI